uniref:Protein brambleberry-like isoform X2 n=1 Tax=Geotrypetes seraphini TaxID=260995 RepID=A0A6P8PPZ7_GEOSA|nr:protein brambleberry-like isoform X2 [Geotrypetes seraphini]
MKPPLLVLLYVALAAPHPEMVLLRQGQTQLQRFQEYANQPRYGECWTRALKRVNAGCRRLSEEEQSRIALSFTHCHLQRSGRSFPECGDGSSVRHCTQDMDPVAFGTYTEFFTHTHSICYFLQSEMWQQEAEDTMSRLTANSHNVAQQLEAANEMAEETIKAQNAVLMSQKEILQNGAFLKKSLQDSTNGIKQAFQDMQQATTEQRLLFAEIFNRVTYLQQFVVGESSLLYSFLYSLLASVAAFLFTSTKRTAGARLILLGLVAVNVYVERSITTFVLGNSESSYEAAERVSFWVSLVRRVSAVVGLAVLLGFIMRHRDVSRESLEILQSLQTRQKELQHILRETEKMLSEADVIPRGATFSSCAHAVLMNSKVLEPLVNPDCTTKPQAKSSVTPKKRNSTSHWRSSPSTEPAICSNPESPSSDRAEPAVYQVRESSLCCKGRHKAELAMYSLPVSLESKPRYSLRNRKSIAGSVKE